MYVVFIVGMAGSGKSVLTANYQDWLKSSEQNAVTLNLDPGAVSLPYYPDVDVRTHIKIEDLMAEYKLGPNGALVMAADLLADHLEEIREEVEEARPEIVLADTPGQIELFALRESGPFIANELSDGPRSTIYLMDGPFCRSPLNFISNLFLAAAVYSRLGQPQVYALTKSDLIVEDEVERIISWSMELEELQDALEKSMDSASSIICKDLAQSVFTTGLVYELISVSAKKGSGLVELNAALTRIFTGGEELRP